ncbi:nucleoside-diphosphate kinase [Sinosporangium album]|uniref:nucleoside-diphosphate kinase n=1 Tax=Sinosporangium album TaxID=504805 RepID=A0A1G7ZJL2_9ACTN|nr:nucleoside-diphosphate kinase [Sinosporangium album]
MTPEGGWDRWTVVLCKPDAVRRALVEPILDWVGRRIRIVLTRQVVVAEQQILTHYADMVALDHRFPFDVTGELRRNYVGQAVTVAVGHGTGEDTARRVRDLLGHYDPARARPDTIRGHFGADSAAVAAAEGRFIDNLVHTSDDAAGAEREFAVWFGPAHLPALRLQEIR